MPRKAKKKAVIEEPKIEAPKVEEEKIDWGAKAAKAGKIIFGILVILAGLFLIWLFLPEFLQVLKGIIGIVLILVGLLVIALGWLD
jgi:hypothetical protein